MLMLLPSILLCLLFIRFLYLLLFPPLHRHWRRHRKQLAVQFLRPSTHTWTTYMTVYPWKHPIPTLAKPWIQHWAGLLLGSIFSSDVTGDGDMGRSPAALAAEKITSVKWQLDDIKTNRNERAQHPKSHPHSFYQHRRLHALEPESSPKPSVHLPPPLPFVPSDGYSSNEGTMSLETLRPLEFLRPHKYQLALS